MAARIKVKTGDAVRFEYFSRFAKGRLCHRDGKVLSVLRRALLAEVLFTHGREFMPLSQLKIIKGGRLYPAIRFLGSSPPDPMPRLCNEPKPVKAAPRVRKFVMPALDTEAE